MFKIAVLVSGSGTNLQSIIDAINTNYLPNTKIVAIISNKPNVYALERSKQNNIPTFVITKKEFANPNDQICNICIDLKVDLIVLAGYLSIITGKLLKQFKNKIINIHPSLIPQFCGAGMYGRNVHEAVYNAKVDKTGCTVHYVNETIDGGNIILQKTVKIKPEYSIDDIASAVLKVEHKSLVEAIKMLLVK